MARHGKRYVSKAEYLERLEIYRRNRKRVEDHNNREDRSYSLGLNKFADLTNAEFREIYGKRR
jgi:hypothetical protein